MSVLCTARVSCDRNEAAPRYADDSIGWTRLMDHCRGCLCDSVLDSNVGDIPVVNVQEYIGPKGSWMWYDMLVHAHERRGDDLRNGIGRRNRRC
jgi:hypothetical protein